MERSNSLIHGEPYFGHILLLSQRINRELDQRWQLRPKLVLAWNTDTTGVSHYATALTYFTAFLMMSQEYSFNVSLISCRLDFNWVSGDSAVMAKWLKPQVNSLNSLLLTSSSFTSWQTGLAFLICEIATRAGWLPALRVWKELLRSFIHGT